MSEPNPNEPATSGSQTRDLIVEFFDDGISRVVPGLAVIALFGPGLVRETITQLHDAVVVFGVVIFVAAWLVGVIFEQVSYLPFAFGCKFWIWASGKVSGKSGWFLRICHRLLPKAIIPTDETKRRHYLKFSSEKVMFRSLAAICFFATWVAPTLFLTSLWRNCLPDFHWSRWYGVAGGVLFFLAWLWSLLSFDQKPPKPPTGREEGANPVKTA